MELRTGVMNTGISVTWKGSSAQWFWLNARQY